MQNLHALYIEQRFNIPCRGDVPNTLLLWAVNIGRAGRQSLVQHTVTPTSGVRGDSSQ